MTLALPPNTQTGDRARPLRIKLQNLMAAVNPAHTVQHHASTGHAHSCNGRTRKPLHCRNFTAQGRQLAHSQDTQQGGRAEGAKSHTPCRTKPHAACVENTHVSYTITLIGGSSAPPVSSYSTTLCCTAALTTAQHIRAPHAVSPTHSTALTRTGAAGQHSACRLSNSRTPTPD